MSLTAPHHHYTIPTILRCMAGTPPGRRRHDHQRRRRLRSGSARRASGGRPPHRTRPPQREDRLQGAGTLPRQGTGAARGRPTRGRTATGGGAPLGRAGATRAGVGRACCCSISRSECAGHGGRDGHVNALMRRPRSPVPRETSCRPRGRLTSPSSPVGGNSPMVRASHYTHGACACAHAFSWTSLCPAKFSCSWPPPSTVACITRFQSMEKRTPLSYNGRHRMTKAATGARRTA